MQQTGGSPHSRLARTRRQAAAAAAAAATEMPLPHALNRVHNPPALNRRPNPPRLHQRVPQEVALLLDQLNLRSACLRRGWRSRGCGYAGHGGLAAAGGAMASGAMAWGKRLHGCGLACPPLMLWRGFRGARCRWKGDGKPACGMGDPCGRHSPVHDLEPVNRSGSIS